MKTRGIFAFLLGAVFCLGGCGGNCSHVWSTWAEESAPTCTEEGMEKRTCPKCGKEERRRTAATGHKWGNWEEIKAPACKVKGLQKHECENCHESETKETDALGHAEGIWASDEEWHWKKCPVCGEILGAREPHEAENGTCTVCGGEIVGLDYAVYENECHVIGIGTEKGDIVIPATYGGKPVTEIGKSAFYDKDITSVFIPDSVVYIRQGAFDYCKNLKSVQLGNHVEAIETNAFMGDASLSEINLPESLKTIGTSAFNGCGVTEIVIPDSVTELGESVFNRCKSLRSISIGNGIKELPNMFCYGAESLTSVSLKDGLTTVGSAAFAECTSLAHISFPSSVHAICEGAFKFSGLSEIVIPDTVETLENAVFYACKLLVRAEIGNGVVSLGEMGQFSDVGVFENCAVLASVTIGSGVKSIASRAFENCGLLTRIFFNGSQEEWRAIKKESRWVPSTKEGAMLQDVLKEVICNNGTLTGKEMK